MTNERMPNRQEPDTLPPLDAEMQELAVHPAMKFLQANVKPILAGVAALLVTVAALSGYGAWQESRAAQARDALAQAVEQAAVKKDASLLAAHLQGAPDMIQLAGYLELARLADVLGQTDVALQAWPKLSALAASEASELAPVALLGHARTLIAAGEPAKAHALLATAGEQPEAYQSFSLRLSAQAAAAAGMKAEALEAYRKLAEIPREELYAKARIAELEAGSAGKDG